MVLINCQLDPKTGSEIPHTCTCGRNETRSGMMSQQCYAATNVRKGQWFYPSITDAYIEEIQSVIAAFRAANPTVFVLTYLHVGPNFQWSPDPQRRALLRGVVDAGSDAVWGTSSHHVQGVEWYAGRPIIYGMGDFLFRHFPGITDYCPVYAQPCEQFRPELAVMHVLNLEANKADNNGEGGEEEGYRVASIMTYPTTHTVGVEPTLITREIVKLIDASFVRARRYFSPRTSSRQSRFSSQTERTATGSSTPSPSSTRS